MTRRFPTRIIVVVAGLLAHDPAGAGEPPVAVRLYAERCSGCHGDDGKGDGPMAAALLPKPRNLRDAAFWRERTVEQARATIAKGKAGTMMPPFAGILTDDEIDVLARHVRAFAPPAER